MTVPAAFGHIHYKGWSYLSYSTNIDEFIIHKYTSPSKDDLCGL